MTQKKRGLGFNPLLGLDQSTVDAVLNTEKTDSTIKGTSGPSGLLQLAIEKIVPNPFQPRTRFNELELDELSDSIRQHGVMQPVVVRQTVRGYELIAGERRWRASQRAGLAEIPALVRDLDDQQVAALALIENIQREQLTAIEQARALARMRDQFSMDQTALATMISSSRSNVANLLRLLNLSQGVQSMLEEGRLEMGHARALLPLPENMQVKTAEDVLRSQLSVRQTETLVKRLLSDNSKRDQGSDQKDPDVSRLEAKLSDRLGASVQIKPKSGGKGHIVIEYGSLDILDGIVARLKTKD
ncbi:MAG TPA: chromosome partitioning protein ParB [Gammaproteobacteria bacterium]|jgi:ParB family chromosome partitioning protein|nr:ParB/RepB/Spo0J family partition protein [Litorivicinaceae bacterium]MDB2619176.1 ParB/RepB/Spo0J family partition protein [Litorivicinaceae bacterium]HAB78111.1 chromosome partitioning protein ParB [Gammaproteobacteria bacterium]HBC48544.1 chromosome partitioning protein ParB [Gammaproteobacteria bacterium]HBZ91475.1 chromosome partitioning protein ParB [Gammaproteobacteria bacterium]